MHARCLGPQYSVILRKMLRVVEYLPFTADQIHKASSAQGSFGDVLEQLSQHTDLEVRSMRLRRVLHFQKYSESSESHPSSSSVYKYVAKNNWNFCEVVRQ